ncbi:MAG: PAS domain S-box protein [Myxococcales bacterium]|nr:PAS domain S-box protein [Myxococcales bacterium]
MRAPEDDNAERPRRAGALWADFDRARVYADIFDQIGEGLVVTRLDGTIVDWNPAAERMFGYARHEAIGRTPALFIAPEDAGLVASVLEAVDGTGSWRQDYTFQRKDGTRGQAEAWILPVRDGEGRPYLTIGANRDVTWRAAAEGEQRLAAEMLDAMTEALHLVRVSDGCFVHVNRAFEHMFGYRAEEIVGRHVSLINAPTHDDPVKIAERIMATLRETGRHEAEIENQRKDGSRFWCRARVTGFTHHLHGEVWLSIHEDITALREAEAKRAALEEQLERAQRLEALGTLASGVAHDFNNILQGLQLTLDAVAEALPEDSPVRGDVERGVKYAERGRDVVVRILDFARSRRAPVGSVELNALMAQTVRLVQPLLSSAIELEMRLSPAPIACRGDAGQLEQVLVNLCTNAGAAMKAGGGRLTIEAAVDPEAPADFVRLSVSDTGVGIPAAIRSRIFDPFFTTKPAGEGTGLGLSIVHNIVKALGGTVGLWSEPGRGTRFDLRLPRAELVDPAPAVAGSAAKRAARVMIVDDETGLLETYRRVLAHRGMAVTVFSTPAAALAAVRADASGYDVVVTDQTMPGMTGVALARAVAAVRADLPVVLISGQVGAAEVEPGVIRAFLAKPFRVGALVETLQRVLGERG